MIGLFFCNEIVEIDRLEQFACDVLNDLIINEPKQNVNIFVHIKEKLEASGFCEQIDRYNIKIELEKSNLDSMALTLAHELVHAKQYLFNEIDIDCSANYHENPWEIEAYELESELVEKHW